MPFQPESQFSPKCPHCRGSGAPNEVIMQDQQRTITYVCSTCQKSWATTDRVPYETWRGQPPVEVARS